jgi:hypothetical protein
MSLILDALRGGTPRATPRPKSNAAQTDAVLQTLGYTPLGAAAPIHRARRVMVILVAVAVLVIGGIGGWLYLGYPRRNATVPSQAVPSALSPVAPPITSAEQTFPRPAPSLGASSTGAASPGAPLWTPAGSSAPILTSGGDHFQLALYYQRSGDFENALLQYRAVLQRDELNGEAHNNLGLLYRDKGLYDEAVKEFIRAIAINQGSVKAHNNLGAVYLNQRKHDAAAAEFRTALGIEPNNAEARYNSALLAEETGDKAGALAHYDAFLRYAGEHADVIPLVRSRMDALKR